MLDGRVLEASQVQYKPFGKPSLQRESSSFFSLGSHLFGERWAAATEVQQEMFSHFALISVERANSFWPRKLSAAPIGFSFQCETLFKALVEHFIPRLQVVDEKEAVGFPRRLLVQLVELLLRQQGAELLHHGVQLVLVAQPPAAEEPHGCATDLHVPAPDEESPGRRWVFAIAACPQGCPG